MSSAADAALMPKRARGHRRVEAILDAAAAVLAERGYEGATMTEIAARSSTAIGSLYRFFPTKTLLAEALAQRYAETLGDGLDALAREAAAGLAPASLADGLVDLMLDGRRHRAATAALLDVAADAGERRAALRGRILSGLAAIVDATTPGAARHRTEASAQVVLQMLKGVSRLRDELADPEPALRETRRALTLYLADVLA